MEHNTITKILRENFKHIFGENTTNWPKWCDEVFFNIARNISNSKEQQDKTELKPGMILSYEVHGELGYAVVTIENRIMYLSGNCSYLTRELKYACADSIYKSLEDLNCSLFFNWKIIDVLDIL